MQSYMEKGIPTTMAQGRSTKIILMVKWILTSWSSIKNSLFLLSRLEVLTFPGGGTVGIIRWLF